MPKTSYILAAMLCFVFSYGQDIIFHENVNYRAGTLHQSLDENETNLLLESESEKILQVDIFNNDYSKSIDVYSNKAKIDLTTLPLGNFVIQAKLNEKWIIMYLEKNRDVQIASSEQKAKAIDDKGPPPVPNSEIITKKGDPRFYWVVSESNSSFGSNKSMRLEYKEDVAKLISKTKLELKSKNGKNNKLLVYEIYNRSKFMTEQLRNQEYYKTRNSKIFNVVPVYASLSEEELDSDY